MNYPYGQQGGQDPYGQQYGGQQYGSGYPSGNYPSSMPPAQPQQTPYPYAGYPPYAPQQTHTLAIVSLICSLAGFLTCISAIAGIITGHMARKQIRENPNAYEGDGMALAGLIVGYVIAGLLIGYFIVVGALFVIGFNQGLH